jgi:hypothetical protein
MSYKDYRKRYDYKQITGTIIRKTYITAIKNLMSGIMLTAIMLEFMRDND